MSGDGAAPSLPPGASSSSGAGGTQAGVSGGAGRRTGKVGAIQVAAEHTHCARGLRPSCDSLREPWLRSCAFILACPTFSLFLPSSLIYLWA